jgi:hypothetical protein
MSKPIRVVTDTVGITNPKPNNPAPPAPVVVPPVAPVVPMLTAPTGPTIAEMDQNLKSKRRGRKGTILTSSSGVNDTATLGYNSILG